MSISRGERIWIILLLAGALLVRVGWGLHLSADETSLRLLPDQVEYLELGKSLLYGHELEFRDERFSEKVWAYRTPGYPAFIATFAANVTAVRIAQAVIDTSTVLAVYLLALRWLPPRRARWAAVIVALSPFLIYFTGLILSETFFIALMVWGMYLLLKSSRWRFLGPGLLAISIMVRPSAIVLPLALTLMRPRLIVPMILMMLALLLPWAARNHAVLGRWIFATTNGGITQYDGFNPHADGSSNQSFVAAMPELRGMDEVTRSDYLGKLARQYAAENPGRAVVLTLRKFMRTWSPIPLSGEFGSRPMYVLIAAIYSIPLDVLVLLGLFRGNLPGRAKVFLMIPAVYLCIAHALSVGSLRYRIPAEVPMAVLVASYQLPVARKGSDLSSLATGN